MTKSDLANSLGIDKAMVEQVDSKQLFVVRRNNNKELYSYYTKVGETRFEDSRFVWILTTRKYSVTTSIQLSQFAGMVRRRGLGVVYRDL